VRAHSPQKYRNFAKHPPHTLVRRKVMRVRLGVALEGGGVRCAAQAGALLALAEAGIRPALYAGCGAGALVAALAATGQLNPKTIVDFARVAALPGCLRERALNKRLHARFGETTLRDARHLAMPTVDLENGAVQVLSSMLPIGPDPRPWSRQALLGGAVRAAMAAPGVLRPLHWRGRRLSGGGQLRGTLPTLLGAMGAEETLLIRVLDAGCARHEIRPEALAMAAHAVVAAPPPRCGLLIQVGDYAPGRGVLDARAAQALLDMGYLAGKQALPRLQSLLGRHGGKILPFPGRC
jgi:predicted acylesterase/phospholipase RssA